MFRRVPGYFYPHLSPENTEAERKARDFPHDTQLVTDPGQESMSYDSQSSAFSLLWGKCAGSFISPALSSPVKAVSHEEHSETL